MIVRCDGCSHRFNLPKEVAKKRRPPYYCSLECYEKTHAKGRR